MSVCVAEPGSTAWTLSNLRGTPIGLSGSSILLNVLFVRMFNIVMKDTLDRVGVCMLKEG